jgi:hypothetical protein
VVALVNLVLVPYSEVQMAPPRDVIRETREFDAMREALRRAVAGESDPTLPKDAAAPGRRTRRKAKRRSR